MKKTHHLSNKDYNSRPIKPTTDAMTCLQILEAIPCNWK